MLRIFGYGMYSIAGYPAMQDNKLKTEKMSEKKRNEYLKQIKHKELTIVLKDKK